jgi:hypothetical protein
MLHYKVKSIAIFSYRINHRERDSMDLSWIEHTQKNYLCFSDSNKMYVLSRQESYLTAVCICGRTCFLLGIMKQKQRL